MTASSDWRIFTNSKTSHTQFQIDMDLVYALRHHYARQRVACCSTQAKSIYAGVDGIHFIVLALLHGGILSELADEWLQMSRLSVCDGVLNDVCMTLCAAEPVICPTWCRRQAFQADWSFVLSPPPERFALLYSCWSCSGIKRISVVHERVEANGKVCVLFSCNAEAGVGSLMSAT